MLKEKEVEKTNILTEGLDADKLTELVEGMRLVLEMVTRKDCGEIKQTARASTVNKSIYYTVEDVEAFLGVCSTKAYKVIQQLNAELAKKGYITVAGRVPKKFFQEKYYGLKEMISDNERGE